MELDQLREILDKYDFWCLSDLEHQCGLERINDDVQNLEWYSGYYTGTRGYYLEDGIVYIHGIISEDDDVDFKEYDYPCFIDARYEYTAQGLLDILYVVSEKAKEYGIPIALNAYASRPIHFHYCKELNRIFVDDKCSETKVCPKCGNHLQPSDMPGYEYICYYCDENLTDQEVE